MTVEIPLGALAASVAERYLARQLSPVFATAFKTALPIVPLAPVTKIMLLPPEGRTPGTGGLGGRMAWLLSFQSYASPEGWSRVFSAGVSLGIGSKSWRLPILEE